MPVLRPANERGQTEIGWLHSRHSFSFGDYYDPNFMGYRGLRVINDDTVEPAKGFGAHSHRDMEIISLVLAGALEHRDSLGHGEILRPGEVQVMSAGAGIRHSEFNPSPDTPVHFLQIWIEPRATSLPPTYAQKPFPRDQRLGQLLRVAGPPANDQALTIQQDAHLYLAALRPGDTVSHALPPDRAAYLHVATGHATVMGQDLHPGDGLMTSQPADITLVGRSDAEVLLFDLP
ncbi:MAG: pirin family protein [Phycisphaeraceae bacterium]|nr:pirin family protein [Phycisphaeraceae bacterium]